MVPLPAEFLLTKLLYPSVHYPVFYYHTFYCPLYPPLPVNLSLCCFIAVSALNISPLVLSLHTPVPPQCHHYVSPFLSIHSSICYTYITPSVHLKPFLFTRGQLDICMLSFFFGLSSGETVDTRLS